MIDKSGEYWHLYLNESCAANLTAISKTVQKLFDECAEMGDVWLLRAKPTVEIQNVFDGDPVAHVYFRFSAKPSITVHGTSITAIGLAQIEPVGIPTHLCSTCREWHNGEHICLTKTYTDLKRELSLANTLLEQRNVTVGEMAQEIERLRKFAECPDSPTGKHRKLNPYGPKMDDCIVCKKFVPPR